MPARYNVTYPTTMVLQAIAGGSKYGFDIADATGLQTGTVYPALRRLEAIGFVRSYWENEKTARRDRRPARRYYQITAAGSKALPDLVGRFEGAARLLRARTRHA